MLIQIMFRTIENAKYDKTKEEGKPRDNECCYGTSNTLTLYELS